MDSQTGAIVLIISAIIALLYYYSIKPSNEPRNRSESEIEKTKVLKQQYDEALVRKDKQEVLRLGREYYSSLRDNAVLTIYDEQAIANDLASIS